MIMWKKRKVMSLIISLFSLVACDTESEEDYSYLETQAALINLQIDWSQKDKMAFFIHKAIPDELNNSIILSVLYKNKKAENLNSKNEIALYKVMIKNNYCNNQEIHKTFFERGVKFIYIIILFISIIFILILSFLKGTDGENKFGQPQTLFCKNKD